MRSSFITGSIHIATNAVALGMGIAFARSGHNFVLQVMFLATPIATLNIARYRTRPQAMGTVHSLSEWRNNFHLDTTPDTGAAVHHQAL